MLSPLKDEVAPLRFIVQGQPDVSYGVDGLETLVFNGQISRETSVARADQGKFRPLGEWEFAPRIFPVKPPALALGQSFKEVGKLRPRPVGLPPDSGHLASMGELDRVLQRDPNDPRAMQLLNDLRTRVSEGGVSAETAIAEHFTANAGLRRRLTSKAVYKYVSDAVRGHRHAALMGAVMADGMLAYVGAHGDTYDRQCALCGALFINLVLGFVAAFAYRLQRWLDMHPFLAGLMIAGCSYAFFIGALVFLMFELGMLPPAWTFWQMCRFMATGSP